eukprot:6325816-Amphidinium_carterae.3
MDRALGALRNLLQSAPLQCGVELSWRVLCLPHLLWTLVRSGLGWPAPIPTRAVLPPPLDEEPDSRLPPGAPWHRARTARVPVPGETRDERLIRQRRWIFARNNMLSPDDNPFAGMEFDPNRNYP